MDQLSTLPDEKYLVSIENFSILSIAVNLKRILR